MKKRMFFVIAFTLLFVGDFSIAKQYGEVLDDKAISHFIADLDLKAIDKKISDDHPDFFVQRVLSALRWDSAANWLRVVQELNPILPQIKYASLSRRTAKDKAELLIGPEYSFHFWRNLAYHLLGRAHFGLKQWSEAEFYFEGVTPDSNLFGLSQIGLGWACLHQYEVKKADQVIDKASSLGKSLTAAARGEVELQRAYLSVLNSDVDQAIKLTQKIGSLKGELEATRLKILSQAMIEKFVEDAGDLSFQKKVARLNEVTQLVEKVAAEYRDPSFSYFAGETYWQLASAYRIEDPSKYDQYVKTSLENADRWMSAWVNRSIRDGRAWVNESAFFFSVAVLWEKDRRGLAIPRLQAMKRIFPNGRYREDVYRLLADYYYEEAEFEQALDHYRVLTEIGSPQKAAYATYKAAWSFYNLGKKWAALRHLQRLFVFYRGDDSKLIKSESLVTETEKDLILVTAELLSFKTAFEELKLYKMNKTEGVALIEKLAETFKKIGRYEESIAAWHGLLNQAINEPSLAENSVEWLNQLLLTIVASGTRKSLAKTIDYYFPKLKKILDGKSEKFAALEKNIVRLVLTVHREGRKTDDPDIWAATDQLYDSYFKHFPDSQDGEIWYFGAQRQERLKKDWEAIRWYQRAALIPNYENSRDSALSVLRLLKEIADAKSLKSDQPVEVYVNLSKVAEWYTEKFPQTKERGLAEVLYLEALYRSRQLEKAREYMASVIKRDGLTREHQDQYLQHNKRLYRAKKWDEAHLFAKAVRGVISASERSKNQQFYSQLSEIYQESAFQNAYELEQSKTAGKAQSREWYENAIKASVDPVTTLKAWHNLLLTYSIPNEVELFSEKLFEFENQALESTAKTKESRQLFVGIYTRATEFWETLGEYHKKAKAITKVLPFIQGKKAEDLKWESAILYGTYYDVKNFDRVVRELNDEKSEQLKDPKNLSTLARLYFWNARYKSSWSIVRSLIGTQKDIQATNWILLRDLFAQTYAEDEQTYVKIKKYLSENRSTLSRVSILQPVWGRMAEGSNYIESARSLAGLGTQSVQVQYQASINEPSKQLRERLGYVTKIIKFHDDQQSKLKPFFQSGVPQLVVGAVCASARISRQAGLDMNQLASPRVDSPQWKDFLKRLNLKANQFKKEARKESKTCDDQMKNLAFLPSLDPNVNSPLCNESECFPYRFQGNDKLDQVQVKMGKKRDTGSFEEVYALLKAGAWAIAEWKAYAVKNRNERSLLLGFIRLALGDTWNAAPLLIDASSSKSVESIANLLLARMAWRNESPQLAIKYAVEIKPKTLPTWGQQLFIDLKHSFDKLRVPAGN